MPSGGEIWQLITGLRVCFGSRLREGERSCDYDRVVSTGQPGELRNGLRYDVALNLLEL